MADRQEPKRRFDSTRWTIVLGAAAKDPSSQEDFGRRYGPIVRAYLGARWRLPDDHERIDDATQDVFVQCFRTGGALERVDPGRPGGFRSFLFGITNNVAANHERKFGRRAGQYSEDEVALDEVEHPGEPLSVVFDRAWAAMVTDEAFEQMSQIGDEEVQRRIAALRYRYHEGLPPRAIAEQAGIEVGQVYRLLETGRAQYRAALLHVMAGYYPGESESALERRCRELMALA